MTPSTYPNVIYTHTPLAPNVPMNPALARVSCHFHVRTCAQDGQHHYRHLIPECPYEGWVTDHPPAVDDLISLTGRIAGGAGDVHCYRVIDRMWMYPEYGSMSWPLGEPAPRHGPDLTVILERAQGPFADEARTAFTPPVDA
jgi:hypothetical protein